MFNPSSSALSDRKNLDPTQALFPLHNWDVNCSFSAFCVVGTCIKFREFLPLDQRTEHVALLLLSGRFESVWTWRYVTISLVNEHVFVQQLHNLHAFHDVLVCWNLPLCHHGRLNSP